MKTHLIILLLFMSCWATAQQTTFNSRHDFQGTYSRFTNIMATDSCYYACGLYTDTLNTQSCFLFSKWNLEGELDDFFTICDTIRFEVWKKTLHAVAQNEFVVAGYTQDTIAYNFFMRFNLSGEVVSFHKYPNYYLDNHAFTTPLDMTEVEDGFVIIGNAQNPLTVSPKSANNFLIKINEYGEEIWQAAFGTDLCDLGKAIIPDQFSDDVFVFSSVFNDCLQNQFLTQKIFIYRVDVNGNETLVKEIGTIEEPEGWCNAVIQLDDGSFTIGTARGHIHEAVNDILEYDNQVIKLSPDFEVEWEQTFSTNLKSLNVINDIIELPNEDGFIAIGEAQQYIGLQNVPLFAQINKASIEGDSLWTRYYQWGNAIGNDQSHSFLDIDLALDGGFVCVGNSIDDTVEGEPTQQAWIIKLDEQGCLVPDCHLIIDTTDAVSDLYLDIDYSIFPNPTSNYINIHYKNAQHTPEGTFKIVNASGQIVYTIAPTFSDITLIIDCSAWERGTYFIQYESLEGVSRGRQIIVH